MDPSVTTGGATADPRLPFDLGDHIVVGGDDVVAPGIEVDVDGRFVDEIVDRPEATTAEVYRWTPDEDQAARIRGAIDEIAGDEDADIHLDPGRFAFDIGGHAHGAESASTDTTVPPPPSPSPGPGISAGDAIARTLAFLDAAGLTPAGDDAGDGVRTFDVGDALAVEVDLALAGDTPVLDAVASLTFDAEGHVIGGYGPLGLAEVERSVDVIDLDIAIRRLALVTALSGYPTTTVSPPGSTTLVSAELVLALRDVVDDTGLPVGEQWLLPTYRFTDAAGGTRTVNAVVATELRLA